MSAAPGRPAIRVAKGAVSDRWIVTFEDGTAEVLGNLTRNDLRSLGHSRRMALGFTRDWGKDEMLADVLDNLIKHGEWRLGQGKYRRAQNAAAGREAGQVTVGSKAQQPSTAVQRLKEREQAMSQGGSSVNPYPFTRYCPNPDEEHASVEVRNAEEEVITRTCPACGETMTRNEPPRIVTVPEVTETVREVTVTDPEVGERLTRLEKLLEQLARGETPAEAVKAPVSEFTHAAFDEAVLWLSKGQHVMLYGEKGTGKSFLARQLARAMGREYFETPCTPGMFVQELTGMVQPATGEYIKTDLHKALEADAFFGLDEVDNGDPAVLGVLNSLMSGGSINFPGASGVTAGPNFRVICTGNTVGTGPTADYEGRVELDKATLNRLARVQVGIDPRVERAMVEEHLPNSPATVEHILAVVNAIRQALIDQGISLSYSPSPRDTVRVAIAVSAGKSIRMGLCAGELAGLEPDQFDTVTAGLDIDGEGEAL